MKKKKVFLTALIVILCALTAIGIGTMAVYKTQLNNTSTATIAKFAFNADVKANKLEPVATGEAGSAEIGTLSVNNTEATGAVSDTTSKYTITLNADTALPAGMSLKLKTGTREYTPVTVDTARKTFIFASDDFLMAHSVQKNTDYKVCLEWTEDAVTDALTLSVTASVTGEQVD